MILTVKYFQVESYEEEEVLIEYTLANPILFKDVVECIVNGEKVHLTKEDLALSNNKIKKLAYSAIQMVTCSSHWKYHWYSKFCSWHDYGQKVSSVLKIVLLLLIHL